MIKPGQRYAYFDRVYTVLKVSRTGVRVARMYADQFGKLAPIDERTIPRSDFEPKHDLQPLMRLLPEVQS